MNYTHNTTDAFTLLSHISTMTGTQDVLTGPLDKRKSRHKVRKGSFRNHCTVSENLKLETILGVIYSTPLTYYVRRLSHTFPKEFN